MTEEFLTLTEEAKLQHEVDYLKARLENIEKFKEYFFKAKTDLIVSKERVSCLENELVLSKVKNCIMGDDGAEDTGSSDVINNDSVLGFIKESLLVTGYKELVASIFRSMDGLGLDMTVKIHEEKDDHIYAFSKKDKKINTEIMTQYKEQGELVEFAPKKLILNLESISVLIKGVPDKNNENYHKIKEFTMMVFMSANLRLASLKKEIELEGLRRNLYQVFKKTHAAFEETRDKMDNQVMDISEMMLKFEKNLKDCLGQMELPESYVKVLILMFHSTKSDLNLLLTSGLCIDENFLKAIIRLEEVYGNKYSVVE
jgi:hypothetical protein